MFGRFLKVVLNDWVMCLKSKKSDMVVRYDLFLFTSVIGVTSLTNNNPYNRPIIINEDDMPYAP